MELLTWDVLTKDVSQSTFSNEREWDTTRVIFWIVAYSCNSLCCCASPCHFGCRHRWICFTIFHRITWNLRRRCKFFRDCGGKFVCSNNRMVWNKTEMEKYHSVTYRLHGIWFYFLWDIDSLLWSHISFEGDDSFRFFHKQLVCEMLYDVIASIPYIGNIVEECIQQNIAMVDFTSQRVKSILWLLLATTKHQWIQCTSVYLAILYSKISLPITWWKME